MTHDALKNLIYGGLTQLMQNKEYYYHSSVNPNFSHWTDEGEKVLVGYLTVMGPQMLAAEQKRLDIRAKEMVMDQLTK